MRRVSQAGKLWVSGVFLAVLALLGLEGCGGNASSRTMPPTQPTASSTQPAPSPPPGSAGTVQWQEAAIAPGPGNAGTAHGTISVNTNGDVTVQVTGVQPNSNYPFQFCPYPGTVYHCFDVGSTLVTDASGNGSLTFHFPQSGTWAGYFNAMSGSSFISTYASAALASVSENLQKMANTNPSGVCGPGGCTSSVQDALGSGSVSANNRTAHVVVTGAAPNATYMLTGCGSGGSDCFTEGNVTTDASGNLTTDIPISPDPTDTFLLQRQGGLGFISGFVVP